MPRAKSGRRSCICCGRDALHSGPLGHFCQRCWVAARDVRGGDVVATVRANRGITWRPSAVDHGRELRNRMHELLATPMPASDVAVALGVPQRTVQLSLARMAQCLRPRVRRVKWGVYVSIPSGPLPSEDHALVLRRCTEKPRGRMEIAEDVLDVSRDTALTVINHLVGAGHLERVGRGCKCRYATTESGAAVVAAWDEMARAETPFASVITGESVGAV